MITGQYEIEFIFPLDDTRKDVQLSANVEVHHSNVFYVVKNIRLRGRREALVPDITIKRLGSRWVHVDSEKATRLSEAAGKAIEGLGG